MFQLKTLGECYRIETQRPWHCGGLPVAFSLSSSFIFLGFLWEVKTCVGFREREAEARDYDTLIQITFLSVGPALGTGIILQQ